MADGVVDDGLDACDLAVADDRAERHLPVDGIARRQMAGLGATRRSVSASAIALVHQDQPRRHADLALMQAGAPGDVGGGDVEVGIVEHDQRVLAAEFELHLLQMLAGEFADLARRPRPSR